MEARDLLRPDRVIAKLHAADKAQALSKLSRRAAAAVGMDTQKICDALVAREHMGSTGIGAGIAVPHARMDGLKDIFALFARLDQPIDFAAVDGRPVDVIVLLLIPPDAGSRHLAALACVSRQLRRPGMAERLRRAKDAGELYALLTGAPA